jgi:alpha-L-fucosidase
MAVAPWWETSRYGLFIHSNVASVPAWSPIGEYADWYRSHLGDPVADVLLHPMPMVEVLAHHRDRWGHIDNYYDFLPLLTFENFDADAWASLAVEAGMSYTVFVSKHHDGVCFWDAPGGSRTVINHGPQRNVMAEYAAACERAGLIFGTYYSLLDWGHEAYPGDGYVEEVLHPQVIDLVERYGSRILWGDGHWGHGPDHWRTEDLITRARALQPELIVNDRWWSTDADIATFEYQSPDDVPTTPWELCRGVGQSFCHNRAERAEHHLDATGIISVLTDVVSRGGNLLLNIGPAADGSIPVEQADPLRRAGVWVREHADLIEQARPWLRAPVPDSDAGVRLLGTADPDQVMAVDLIGRGTVAVLGPEIGVIRSVQAVDGAPIEYEHDRGGLRIRRLDRSPQGLAAVYRVEMEPQSEAPIALFEPEATSPLPLAPLLEGAAPGSVIRLGEGTYVGPVTIPERVTVRGLGPDRTRIAGGGTTAVTLGVGARLEHVAVIEIGERLAWLPLPAVVMAGNGALVLGTRIDGHVIVAADGARIRGSSMFGVVADSVAEVLVSRSELRGMRWDTGVEITGGHGHHIEGCDLVDHLCAIRLIGTIDTVVRGNSIRGRWWGVHLRDTEASHVVANSITTTMRAVDVEGGTEVRVDSNAVADGDSGCLVEAGATGVTVSGNHWSRCRIGMMCWDAGEVWARDNTAVDLHEAAEISGP